MGKFLDSFNNKKVDTNKNTTTTQKKVGKFVKSFMESKIGLDTLDDDLKSLGTTVEGIYNGWQDQDTMNNTKANIVTMQERLNAYQEYAKLFGGEDVTELANGYKAILEDWDNRASVYGQYKNADAYNAVKKNVELEKRFSHEDGSGYTFDEVQAELKKYAPDSDEYKYLSTYTNYSDLNDFYKAMESGGVKSVQSQIAALKAEKEKLDSDYKASGGWMPSASNYNRPSANQVKPYQEWQAKSSELENKIKALEDSGYYGELKTKKNVYELEHKVDLYKPEYEGKADFEENSKYVTTYNENKKTNILTGPLKYEDLTYEYINNVDGARDEIEAWDAGINQSSNGYESKWKAAGYDLLHEDEIAIYNYKYHVEGEDSAKKFLDDMQTVLDKRRTGELSERWEQNAEKLPILSNAATVILKPAGAIVGAVDDTINAAQGKDYNPYSYAHTISNYVSDTRKYTGEDIAESTKGVDLFGQNVPSFLYNTGMSIADSAYGVATFGKFNSLLMGTSAYQEKAKEMVEAGADQDVVWKSAITSGVAETLFEHIGIDNLFKIKNVDSPSSWVKNALKQAGAEGAEEIGTEITNIIADDVIRGKDSELYKMYSDLIERGYSESEALSKTALQAGSQVAWAGIGGALSGAVMGGVAGANNYANNKSVGKEIRGNERVTDMLNIASLSPQGSDALAAYTEYANRGVNADNITDAQLGNLYGMVDADARGVLASKKATTEQKADAETTLNRLAKTKTENKVAKVANELSQTDEEGVVTPATRETIINEQAKGMSEAEANLFRLVDDGHSNAVDYADSFNLVVAMAQNEYDQDYILEHRGVLSTAQVNSIYQSVVTNPKMAQQKRLDALIQEQGDNLEIKGKVDDSVIDYGNTGAKGKVNWNDLHTNVKATIAYVTGFSTKVAGMDVQLVTNGRDYGFTGQYDRQGNTMLVDITALTERVKSADTKGRKDNARFIVSTVAHEVTHWMEEKAPELYSQYDKMVMDALTSNGRTEADVLGRRRALLEKAEAKRAKKENRKPREITDKEVRREVIARASEDMLALSEEGKKFFESLTENEQKQFVDKIKEVIQNIKDWIKNVLSNLTSDAPEAQELRALAKDLDAISKKWDEMLRQAAKSNAAMKNAGVNDKAIMESKVSDTQNADIDTDIAEQYNNWESYALTDEFLTKVPPDERGAFLRSLANQTTGMKRGEQRNIIIYTETHVYFYVATGYMNGSIDTVHKRNGKKVNAKSKAWRDISGSSDANATTFDSWTQNYGSVRGRNGGYNAANGYAEEAGRVDNVDDQAQGSNSVGYNWEGDGDFSEDEELIPGSLVYTDDGRVVKVNDDGTTEDVQFSDIDEDTQTAINQTMTMQQAKDMIQRAFVLNNIRDWYDDQYKNGDEWLAGEGANEVATYIENTYEVYEKYIGSKHQGIVDGDWFVEDIVDAYVNKTLTGKVKEKTQWMDLSKNVAVADKRFYSPKEIKNAKKKLEIARQRLTKDNKVAVTKARAEILLYAHNKGAAETLGLTESELKKMLRQWGGYSAAAREISMRFNNNVAISNRWVGIENCSWLKSTQVSEKELARLVNSIEGDSRGFERNYIARTTLALDTHIDWSEIKFVFTGVVDPNRRSVRGLYDNRTRTVTASYGSQNTVAHEMGHALDYKWARDLGFSGNAFLTDRYLHASQIKTEEEKLWYSHFKEFVSSLTDKADLTSEYTMRDQEVFARFVASFVEWVDRTATGRASYGYTGFNDRFTGSDYVAFVKILQEKAMLDSKSMSVATDVQYSDIDTEYMKAVESGDMEKVQKMVDDAAKKAGFSVKAYHGTPSFGFTKFDPAMSDDKTTLFFSESLDVAKTYAGRDVYGTKNVADAKSFNYEKGKVYTESELKEAHDFIQSKYHVYGTTKINVEKQTVTHAGTRYSAKQIMELADSLAKKGVYGVFLNTDGFLRVDAHGRNWANMDIPSDFYEVTDNTFWGNDAQIVNTRDYAKYAKQKGYRGITIENVRDFGNRNTPVSTRLEREGKTQSTIHVLFDSTQVKSADPITYDDNGNVIPLSKRFDSTNEDIRYSDIDEDSDGNKLTAEQREFFKDSKVRDADGNLLVVYHGTYEDFTIFDITKTASANAFGKGHYFTSQKTDAQNNYASGKGADVLTKIEGLAWLYFEEMGYTEEDYESNDSVDAWNEAYDKAEAFYQSGKVLELYLDIKNPVYARGSELYDANGNFVSARSAEYLKELGYDGIIDYEAADKFGSFQDLDESTAHYVVFDSNQIKLTSNRTPTSNPDIRYSDIDELDDLNAQLKEKQNQIYSASMELRKFDAKAAEDKLYAVLKKDGASKQELDGALQEYAKWGEESGYANASAKLSALKDEEKLLRREIQKVEDKLHDELKEQIAHWDEEDVKKYVAKAVRKYHTTTNLEKASYLVRTGSMLDFSDGQGYRVKDHREISEILDLPDYAEYSDGMIAFMNMGNIRLQTYGIDVSAMPNAKQFSALRDIIFKVMRENDEFSVDFSKTDGYSAGSVTYGKGTSASKIIADIKSYFETGVVPEEQSSIRDFLYSDIDVEVDIYEVLGENKRLNKENKTLRADFDRLMERLKLERQLTHGNHFNENQLDAVAVHIRNLGNSNYSKPELINKLRDVYTHIATSKEVTWDDLFARFYGIAEDVLGEARPVRSPNDYYANIYRDLRNAEISLSDGQKKYFKDMMGVDAYKAFFGKIKVSDKGIPLNSKWQEWAEKYPNEFAETNDKDQVLALLDIYETAKELKETVEEYNEVERTRWLANEIYNQYWNVSPIRTTADKYDQQIKRLNYEHRNAMKELRDSYNERLEKQKKADRAERSRIFKKLREDHIKELKEIRQHGKERLDKYKEEAARKTRIQSITAQALTLNEWLVKNSKDKHIHESMKGPVVTLLQAIDFSSKRALGMWGGDMSGVPTNKDISLQKALSQVQQMMADASVGKEELVLLYGHELDADIKAMIESVDNIMRNVGDNEFILNKMTLDDLITLDNVVKTIKHAVTQMNKFHIVHHAKGIANLAQEEIIYAEKLGKATIYKDKSLKAGVKKLLAWKNINPYYAFKRFGTAGKKIFEAFQDGYDKFAFNIKEIIDFTNSTYKAKEVQEWEKEIKSFKLRMPATEEELSRPDYKPKYQEVQMTVAQVMDLYLLNKREAAREHLLGGGIRVADIETKGSKIISQTEGALLEQSEIDEIIKTLTPRQIEVADALSRFMNTVSSDWGNEVSMARFGYKAFGEKNYVPMQVDKNNLAVDDETEKNNSLFRLLNMSFTKALTEKASNRLVVSSIFDVFAQHTSDMAKYNALALPVLDAFRWFNYKEKGYKGETAYDTKSVKQAIESAFGKDGQSYITTFLKDLNGQENTSRDTVGRGFFTKAKVAAVAANIRVALLQPTAYLKASANIDSKYLWKALMHKPKIGRAEKYSGMALWKSLGYFDTNVQRGVAEQIKHAETAYDKAVEWSMKGAEWGDKLTFGYLWNAAELEIREKRKDLKVGSEEFYKEVGIRLRDIIYATQVVDSVMTRSEMMRSPDWGDKLITTFASEPTLAYNMLADAVLQTHLDARELGSKKEAIKKNRKHMARVVVAYTTTNLVAALIESGFDVLRDDDDEEMDMAEFMKLYLENFATNQSILAKIPWLNEAVSIMQGFSSTRMDTQGMQTFANAFKQVMKLVQGEGSWGKTIKSAVQSFSYLSGLPFYNAWRDLWASIDKFIVTDEELEEILRDFY